MKDDSPRRGLIATHFHKTSQSKIYKHEKKSFEMRKKGKLNMFKLNDSSNNQSPNCLSLSLPKAVDDKTKRNHFRAGVTDLTRRDAL